MPRHASIVDFFRRSLPSNSFVRPYAKRIVEDCRTLLRWPLDWTRWEKQPPQTLFIEPTNICNANCIFCAYRFQTRFRKGRGVMSDEIFEKALHDYLEMGGKRKKVSFTPLVGEPLIDPKIVQRARRAGELGLQVHFFTNGLLLHKIDLEALLDAQIEAISISTAPFDRETHERLYRTQANHTTALRSSLVLVKRGEKVLRYSTTAQR